MSLLCKGCQLCIIAKQTSTNLCFFHLKKYTKQYHNKVNITQPFIAMLKKLIVLEKKWICFLERTNKLGPQNVCGCSVLWTTLQDTDKRKTKLLHDHSPPSILMQSSCHPSTFVNFYHSLFRRLKSINLTQLWCIVEYTTSSLRLPVACWQQLSAICDHWTKPIRRERSYMFAFISKTIHLHHCKHVASLFGLSNCGVMSRMSVFDRIVWRKVPVAISGTLNGEKCCLLSHSWTAPPEPHAD